MAIGLDRAVSYMGVITEGRGSRREFPYARAISQHTTTEHVRVCQFCPDKLAAS